MSEQRISTSADDRQSSILRPGDQVTITVTAAVDTIHDDGDLILGFGGGVLGVLPVGHRNVTITRVVPSWYPPAPGQLVHVCGYGEHPAITYWVTERAGTLWLVDASGDTTAAEPAIQRHLAAGHTVELADPPTSRCEDDRPCQAERFSDNHQYQPVREVADDWEVCCKPADDPIHRAPTCGACGADTWLTKTKVAHKRNCPHLVAAALDAADEDPGLAELRAAIAELRQRQGGDVR